MTIVIGFVIFPAAEHDTDPFKGQGPDRRVVLFAVGALLLIIQFGPSAELPGLIGELVERLKHKLGTRPAAMYPKCLATTLRYRRYTRELLDLQSGFKAIPICAEGCRQPRG